MLVSFAALRIINFYVYTMCFFFVFLVRAILFMTSNLVERKKIKLLRKCVRKILGKY